MRLPAGFAELGGGGEESPESSSEGSMLEQHLRAFKRALDSGNFKRAAECFSAAIAEEGSAPDDESAEYDEE